MNPKLETPPNPTEPLLPLDLDERELKAAERENRISTIDRLKRVFNPATKGDREIYRRLFKYVRPHLAKVILAIVMAASAGGLILYQLVLVDQGLSVIDPESGGLKDAAKSLEQEGDVAVAAAEPAAPASAVDPAVRVQRRHDLKVVIAQFFGVVMLAALLKFVQELMMAGATRKMVRHIRDDCFAHLVQLPLRFHHSMHSGRITARLTKDIDRLRELLISLSIGVTTEIFTFLGALIFTIWATKWAALFAIAFVVLVLVPIRLISDRLRYRDRQEEAGQADVFAILGEALAGQKVVKAFTGEKHEVKRFKKATKSVYRRQVATQRLRAMTEPLVDIFSGLGIAAAIWFLGSWAIDDKAIQVGLIAAVVLALQRIATSVKKLGKYSNDFSRGITAAERVVRLLDVEPEVRQRADAVPLAEFRDAIRFEGASFGYDPATPVLKDIDLTVKRGETVAIVGPSGAGKTSLVDLVPRFYDVDAGRITLDGRDIRDYTLKSLRATIGIVSQDTMLFRDSIKENIAYGLKDVSDEAVIAAAKAASAHDFIVAKEDGYETPLGERGLRLSGGERQRIAIARALLKNPPILILDEATSALDAESEARVQDALNYLMEGRTTLVIAHRLSTIALADTIVVLDKGRIVEQGTHDELLALDGRYARAYRLQKQALDRGERDATFEEFFRREES